MLEQDDPQAGDAAGQRRLAMRWWGAQNQLFASLVMLPEEYEHVLTLLGRVVAQLRPRTATRSALCAAADGIDAVVAEAAQGAPLGPDVDALLPLLGPAALAMRWQELDASGAD